MCDWLQELMHDGQIPRGDIDGRSIWDIHPSDIRKYDQCHFFSGIAGWAQALKLAKWGNRRVWSGSPPCQPYSGAGKGLGDADERALWPAWFHLIAECKPNIVFGEQVASAVGKKYNWLDLVGTDLEHAGYTVGAALWRWAY